MDALEIAARNRRLSRRRRAKNFVQLTCYRNSMGLGPNIGLNVLDLSESGIRMLVRAPLKTNDEILIELLGVGHRRPIKLPAQVCWVVATADGVYCVGASFQRRLRYADLQQLV